MRARAIAVVLAAVSMSLPEVALAETTPAEPAAIFAGKPLPDGAVSVFGTLGYPGVQLGFRQGLGGLELGAVAGFDYSLTQITLDVPLRIPLRRTPESLLGVGLSIGGFADFGATFIESSNASSAGLRFSAMAEYTRRVTHDLDLFAELSTPIELALTTFGNNSYGLDVGGGAELGVGDGYTVGAQLLLGPDLLYPRNTGANFTRFEISVLAGVGKRFF